MSEPVFTLGMWRVKPDQQAEFIQAWKELSMLFARLPMPPGGKGTLVQSFSDPSLFYSFGEWSSIDAVQAMREEPTAVDALRKLAEMCTEAEPGSFKVVAEA